MTTTSTTEPDFGWGFPPTFSQGGKGVQRSWGEQDLHDSLRLLLSTRPGEHPIYPDFGCALDEFMFQQMDQNMINLIHYRVSRSIESYEDRIILEDVEIEPDESEGRLILHIHYTLKATGQSAQYVSILNLFP